jgi:hypothetical protein
VCPEQQETALMLEELLEENPPEGLFGTPGY